MCFSLNPFFHTSTSSTPSIRADSSSQREAKIYVLVVTDFETDIYIANLNQATRRIRYTRACGARAVFLDQGDGILGVVKVASLHLPSIVSLYPLLNFVVIHVLVYVLIPE